jgi:hypothetical protein
MGGEEEEAWALQCSSTAAEGTGRAPGALNTSAASYASSSRCCHCQGCCTDPVPTAKRSCGVYHCLKAEKGHEEACSSRWQQRTRSAGSPVCNASHGNCSSCRWHKQVMSGVTIDTRHQPLQKHVSNLAGILSGWRLQQCVYQQLLPLFIMGAPIRQRFSGSLCVLPTEG